MKDCTRSHTLGRLRPTCLGDDGRHTEDILKSWCLENDVNRKFIQMILTKMELNASNR